VLAQGGVVVFGAGPNLGGPQWSASPVCSCQI